MVGIPWCWGFLSTNKFSYSWWKLRKPEAHFCTIWSCIFLKNVESQTWKRGRERSWWDGGGIAQEIARQREHSCDGEKPKSHFGQPKLLEKLTTCTAPQTKEQGMFTWRSGGKSARTDGVAPALLSHLRRLRPLQKPRDLWGAVSCALPLCCRKMHLHLPCTRRAALVLYI